MSDYVDTVDIEGTQYDIQDTATKQTADQNKQDIEAIKESADYSTEEHLTGRKWLDGKPTYEKTVSCGALPNNTTKSIAHNVANIDKIIKMRGFATNPSDGSFIPLPYATATAQYIVRLQFTLTNIQIGTTVDSSAFSISYATLEYTKSTDSPQP